MKNGIELPDLGFRPDMDPIEYRIEQCEQAMDNLMNEIWKESCKATTIDDIKVSVCGIETSCRRIRKLICEMATLRWVHEHPRVTISKPEEDHD